jgi:N-acetylmuramic acid 6-phosphate etherase
MSAPTPATETRATEQLDPRFADLDAWTTEAMLRALWEGQLAAIAAVGPALPTIERAIEAMVPRLQAGGRIIYVGAGTSGRIGVQDGSELPPTFHWPVERVAFVMAGGLGALTRSVEGAEDDAPAGAKEMDRLSIGPNDVVIGLAASGSTPFTIAAVARARECGALTISLANNPQAPLLTAAAHPLLIETGPEAIAGSTRMKAGTAHKIVLNLISTGVMIRLGRVHGSLMVEMRPTNVKLRARAIGMVARISGCDRAAAETALDATQGDIKAAVLVAHGASAAEAAQRLEAAKGRLRDALTT